MEIFKNVKSLLVASGVLPTSAVGNDCENRNLDKLFRAVKILVFLTIFFGFYLLTFIYSIKYLRIMEAIQAAGYINNGVLCVGIGYAILIYNRKDLLSTIGGWELAIFSRIKSKPSSKEFYVRGTDNISKIFKRISIFYLCLTVSIFTTTVIIVPIVHLLYGNHDPTTWVQVYDAFIFPFEKDSYLTFFGKNLTVFITTLCYYTAIASFMLILMSTCVCYESCIDDLQNDLQLAKSPNRLNDLESTNHIEFGRTLIDAVEYQNVINEHLKKVGGILSGILFLSILNGVTTMALALFYIEEELSQMSAHVVTSFDIFLIQAITCLIYCYFGNRITSKSLQVSDTAYAMEWYRLPQPMKMAVKLIILRSQRENYFSGMSVIVCSLEMYKKIMDTAFSYYLIVRSVSK